MEYKSNQPNPFSDDAAVPNETLVCYSKIVALIYIIVGFSFFCIAVYLGVKHHNWGSIIFSVVLGIASLTLGIALLYNRKPLIIINADGITAPPGPFNSWGQINHEEVIQATSGKLRPHYLVYEHGKVSERINLTGLDISHRRLAYFIQIYRGRSKKSKSR